MHRYEEWLNYSVVSNSLSHERFNCNLYWSCILMNLWKLLCMLNDLDYAYTWKSSEIYLTDSSMVQLSACTLLHIWMNCALLWKKGMFGYSYNMNYLEIRFQQSQDNCMADCCVRPQNFWSLLKITCHIAAYHVLSLKRQTEITIFWSVPTYFICSFKSRIALG